MTFNRKFWLLLTFLPGVVLGQSTLLIPYAATPVIDGSVAPGEWENAAAVEVPILNGSKKVAVRLMHDSARLHIAFWGPLESANIRFPEVLIDVEHNKSAAWLPDDWWFHVSASDCEHQGQYGIYDSCAAERPNWTARNNFSPGLPKTDTVEIQIPFALPGIDLQQTDSIGIAFVATNTASAWDMWPAGANRLSPATWGNAVFGEAGVSGVVYAGEALRIFPNPVHDRLWVPAGSDAELFDLNGRRVLEQSNTDRLELAQLPRGVYLLRLRHGRGQEVVLRTLIKK